jgi:hypothetical protein
MKVMMGLMIMIIITVGMGRKEVRQKMKMGRMSLCWENFFFAASNSFNSMLMKLRPGM